LPNSAKVPRSTRNFIEFAEPYRHPAKTSFLKLLCVVEKWIEQQLYIKIKSTFDEMEISGELKFDMIDVFFRLLKRIRRAIVEQDLDTLIFLKSFFRKLLGMDDNHSEDKNDDDTDYPNQLSIF
jgi:hypothetical protein